MRIPIFHRSAKEEAASETERKATKEAAETARKILDQQFDSLFGLMNETLNSIKGDEQGVQPETKDKGASNGR